MSIFLDPADVAILTGKKTKAGQIAQLRHLGLVFYVNAGGKPVVPKSSVETNSPSHAIEKPWTPNVLRNGSKTN